VINYWHEETHTCSPHFIRIRGGLRDPDLYGFQVKNAKYTTLENIKVHQQYRGVGVGLSEADSVALDRAELCKAPGHDPQQTPLSLTCDKSSISRLSNSSFGLTSGCGSLISGWKTCK